MSPSLDGGETKPQKQSMLLRGTSSTTFGNFIEWHNDASKRSGRVLSRTLGNAGARNSATSSEASPRSFRTAFSQAPSSCSFQTVAEWPVITGKGGRRG